MMPRVIRRVALGAIVAITVWWLIRTPEPTVLSFRVTQTFEEVVRNSTYPVIENSVMSIDNSSHGEATFVEKTSVILRFDDPKHGFTLPPTKFAVIGYSRNHVSTIATSPMLENLPFDETVAILENLQNQFKAGGWEPWEVDDSTWFDLSPEGKKRLYLRMFEPGEADCFTARSHEIRHDFSTQVRGRLLDTRTAVPFLIDVGVSDDTSGWEPGDPMVGQIAPCRTGGRSSDVIALHRE
jgi:hypothetical protein